MVPIVAVVALVVSSCGLLHRDDNAAPAPTSTSESTPDGALTRFTAEVDGVHVEVTPSAADRDRGLTIEAVDATIPTVETRLASTSPISITLDGGAGQPSQPLKVQFDLSDRPDLAAAITDKARPVLESVSATNPDQRAKARLSAAAQRSTAVLASSITRPIGAKPWIWRSKHTYCVGTPAADSTSAY